MNRLLHSLHPTLHPTDPAADPQAVIDGHDGHDGIVVVNAGSSSLKFAVFAAAGARVLDASARGQIEGIGTAPHFSARDARGALIAEQRLPGGTDLRTLLGLLIGWIEGQLGGGRLRAAGHRVTTGGLNHAEPALIDDALIARLRDAAPLAPLHQALNLVPIEALARLYPSLPQVACFDTRFHATVPEVAARYALPRRWTEAGARRYGYHGLSYEYIAGELHRVDARAAKGRTIVAHLGNGASLCALQAGRSVATTMGFSTLGGLVMGTRPGEVDPGLLLWLLRQPGMDADRLEAMLYHDSGLAGVSGLGSDMRTLLASSDPHARDAVALFVYRLCAEIGSMAAALQGLDALVFTAGIGERSAAVRAAVCRQSAWLGIALDEAANARGGPRISSADSAVSVWVVPTDEERAIAGHVARLVVPAAAASPIAR